MMLIALCFNLFIKNKKMRLSKILKKILRLKDEHQTQNYFKNKYKRLHSDEVGNLYYFLPDTVCLNAHLDNVGSDEAHQNLHNIQRIKSNGKTKIQGTHNIGADDKCGLAFIDYFLSKNNWINKAPDNISIMLTVEEETGMLGSRTLAKHHKDDISNCNFIILLDRRNKSDVIKYCDDDMMIDLQPLNQKYGYKKADGLVSDLDNLCDIRPGINISCGYYDAHYDTEYIIWEEYANAVAYALDIIKTLGSNKYKPYKRQRYSYSYNYTDYCGYWYDYDAPTTYKPNYIEWSIVVYNNDLHLYNKNWEYYYVPAGTYTVI